MMTFVGLRKIGQEVAEALRSRRLRVGYFPSRRHAAGHLYLPGQGYWKATRAERPHKVLQLALGKIEG